MNASIRDKVTEHLNQDIQLVLSLAGSTDGRAQSVAGAVSILITSLGVAVSVDGVAHRVDRANAEPLVYVAFALLTACLVLACVAAFPRKLTFNDADNYADLLQSDIALRPYDAASFAPIVKEIDKTSVELYRELHLATKRRGQVLGWAVRALVVAVTALAWTGFRTLRYG